VSEHAEGDFELIRPYVAAELERVRRAALVRHEVTVMAGLLAEAARDLAAESIELLRQYDDAG
jgi:hypothetical protein